MQPYYNFAEVRQKDTSAEVCRGCHGTKEKINYEFNI